MRRLLPVGRVFEVSEKEDRRERMLYEHDHHHFDVVQMDTRSNFVRDFVMLAAFYSFVDGLLKMVAVEFDVINVVAVLD